MYNLYNLIDSPILINFTDKAAASDPKLFISTAMVNVFHSIAYFYKQIGTMKYIFILLVLFALGTGCKRKVLSGPELQNKLIETMQAYLNSEAKPGAEFKVKDVNYYPEKATKSYDCEFHVDMKLNGKDTVGIMTATISNDFKRVERKR